MLFITEYRLKPNLPKAEVKRLMDVFGKRGAAEGEVAHYVRADGTGGYTVIEADDITSGYEGLPRLLGVHDVHGHTRCSRSTTPSVPSQNTWAEPRQH